MQAKFIVETNSKINFSGLAILDKTYILRNDDKVLGHAFLKFEGSNLVAYAEVIDEALDLYPVISFEIIKKHKGVIELSRLKSVSLIAEPNPNPDIMTIKEQMALTPVNFLHLFI